MICAPPAQARAPGGERGFAGSLTAMRSEGLGVSGVFGGIGNGHYAFTTRGRPVKMIGGN